MSEIKIDDTGLNTVEVSEEITTLDKMENFNISDDNKALLDEVKGVGFNKDGDLVDNENKVLLSIGELKLHDFNTMTTDELKAKYFEVEETTNTTDDVTYTVGDQYEIEGVTYTVDANGDAVAEGKDPILKDDLVKLLEEEQGDTSMIDAIATIDGYELKDEQGQPLVFEDTPEGIASRNRIIIERSVEEQVALAMTKQFDNNPDLKAANDYINTHGNLDGFDNYTDYSTLTIDKDDKEQQRQFVLKSEIARGRSKEDATRIVGYIEQDGKLYEESVKSLEGLVQGQVKEIEEANIYKEQQEALRQENYNKLTSAINVVTTTGNIAGFKLPDNLRIVRDGQVKTVPRSALNEYLLKPVSNGLTQAQLDRQAKYNESYENMILDDVMLFLGMDTSQLISQEQETKKIKKITTRRNNVNGGGRKIVLKSKVKPINDVNFN